MATFVRFFQKPHFMEFLSEKEGRPVYEMRDYIRIEIPGITANVVETFVLEHHKRENPVQWAQYMTDKATGNLTEHQGTLLSDWPQLTAAQVLEMKHYKFYTVEQVAEASDLQIQTIGMLAGMAPASLRDKAKAWLEHSKTKDTSAEVAKRDAEIAELRAIVERLSSVVEPKNKGGRPRKEEASV